MPSAKKKEKCKKFQCIPHKLDMNCSHNVLENVLTWRDFRIVDDWLKFGFFIFLLGSFSFESLKKNRLFQVLLSGFVFKTVFQSISSTLKCLFSVLFECTFASRGFGICIFRLVQKVHFVGLYDQLCTTTLNNIY